MRTSTKILIICDATTNKVLRVIDCDTDEEYLKHHRPGKNEIAFFHDRGSLPSPINHTHVAYFTQHYEQKAKELNTNKK